MKSLTVASHVVSAFGCTLEIFLVTLDEALDLIHFPVPHWKTQNSNVIAVGRTTAKSAFQRVQHKMYSQQQKVTAFPGSQGY